VKAPAILTLVLNDERDVVLARQRAKQVAGLLDFGLQDQTRIATTVSELARNAVIYGGGGRVELFLEGSDPPQALAVRISDEGPGIAHLDEILSGRYASRTGMGLGIVGSRRLMDSFHIDSRPGDGTVVTVGKLRPASARPISGARLEEIAAELVKQSARTPLDEVQEQNQELLRALDILESNRQELIRLNTELLDTNRGIVALYAELDEKAKELNRANEIKSRFLAHMSHEIRTPLNSITALSRLLLDEADGALTGEQAKQVKFIRRASGELLDLVNDLLDLSKVEAGTMSVRLAPCSVSDVVSSLRGMFLPLHSNPRVALVFEDQDLPSLYTDGLKLTQILRNLISNALKFTDEGEVRVSASLLDSGAAIVFSVADTGVGIAEEDLERAFQEFGQVPNRLQGTSSGSGLGLAISRKLAELLGGAVSAESKAGSGSTFRLELPLDAAAASRASTNRVLLIDDSEVDRYVLRGLLEDARFEVIEASNGAEGLRMARAERPDVVFIDLVMPDQSGVEVLRQLREDDGNRELPAFVITSKALGPKEQSLLETLGASLVSKTIYSQPSASALVERAIRKAVRECAGESRGQR
jgi:signal transduction histidine kinase